MPQFLQIVSDGFIQSRRFPQLRVEVSRQPRHLFGNIFKKDQAEDC
jgi:hypothetical protein